MKIAVIADTHFSNKTDEIHRVIFRDLMQQIALTPVDFLIFLGDFLDSQNCSPELFRFLVQSLEPIRRGSIPIYFILGDHEMSNPFRATPLIYFSELAGCRVIENATGANLRHMACMFLPSTVKDLNALSSDHDAVFYHGFLQNAKVSSSYRMYRPSDFGIADFVTSGAKYYFFGGIHQRQIFKFPGIRKVEFAGYVGALFQRTFGDEGNPAGYLIWDSETGVRFVDIQAPRYKTVRFSGRLFRVVEALQQLELPEGQWNLRIILDLHFDSEDIKVLRKIAAEKGLLSLHFETKAVEKKSGEARPDQITLEDSPVSILGEWLKIKEIGPKKREIILKRAETLRKTIASQ